ncbi:hypothetical protein C2S51_007944 [Perilla frutescens var. frutescens]|nr:hypothetical protein C2S51_007944 [Perilla frutescens var. frutescens]
MGCSASKEEDLPLVVRCRERQELIRAAANHRYALAAAHVSYFRSLKEVGEALRKFVDEELITASSSSSSFSSPSLTLPPSSKKNRGNGDESPVHLHDDGDSGDEFHLHLSDSSSDEDGDLEDHHHHHHHHGHSHDDDEHQHHHSRRSEERARNLNNEDESSSRFPHVGFSGYVNGFLNGPFANPYPFPNPYPIPHPGYGEPYSDRWDPQEFPPPAQPWFYSGNSNAYFMKKSAPATKTVVQNPPAEPSYGYSDSYWNSPAGYGGNYGFFPMGSPARMGENEVGREKPERDAPPPPSPKVTAWDFFDPFNVFDSAYPGYYSGGGFGYGSNYSSPDSTEVREREGIPDLEEETESEVYKEVHGGGRKKVEGRKSSGGSSPYSRAMPMPAPAPARKTKEASSRSMPMHRGEGSSRSVPPHRSDNSSRSVQQLHRTEGSSGSGPSSRSKGSSRSVSLHKIDSSSTSLPSWSSEESEKPSMPPHNDGNGSKSSMASRHREESVKPSMPIPHGEGTSWVDQPGDRERPGSISLTDDKSSSENVVLKSADGGSGKKKGVTFEVEETSKQDGDSSKLSSVALSSPRGTRDLREVVAEIRDEFETASSYGKEVAMMLEVGKLPYQPSFFKVIISRMLYLVSPSASLWDSPSKQSAKLASNTMKLAKSYFEEVGNDVNMKACHLSSTLDRLYAWEKKLYKEVKDEERLRVIYEKQHKRLKTLDEKGAESRKIDAARASIRKLITKLDVSIKAIDSISSRIHKLRDEELQPQLAELVHGLTRMWKAMLKCHQKQFQAVMESRMRRLKSNIGQTDSGSRATTELERELRAWCGRFSDWIRFQRSYVESLNEWLIHCLQYEPEETPDGPVPYSPGRLGAPPIFIICNDWYQAMEAMSETRVANAMNTFAASLQQLWEKQDEEGRQRLRAEFLSKDYEKHLRSNRMEKGKTERDHDAMSDKTGLSVIPSDSGVSALDDLKVDLDSMRHKLAEERLKHKDAMKLVHDAASGSLKGGLVPIFKALESFTSEAVKAHEHVRVKPPGQTS